MRASRKRQSEFLNFCLGERERERVREIRRDREYANIFEDREEIQIEIGGKQKKL